MVNGYWIEMHPDDYIIEMAEGEQRGCMIGIQATDA